MKIAIIGTRGIPNNYGGFERCAEFIAAGFVKKGHDITVYNSHKHNFREHIWNNVHIIHRFDPEYKLGTFGQFIYDLNCILDTRKRKYDIILQLGYTSSSLWGWLLPRYSIITTNMDGLEWKRGKYSKPVKFFLKFAEYLGVYYSDYLIADSKGIQQYYLRKYKKNSVYIPYGALPPEDIKSSSLNQFNLEPFNYYLILARMEPENSIEIILDGIVDSGVGKPVLIIGNNKNRYGKKLIKKFKSYNYVRFIGAIYDNGILNALRYYSSLYFHGHTVGGTNPSLLEAMACSCLIYANDNEFNREVLNDNAYYFRTAFDISGLIKTFKYDNPQHKTMIRKNLDKIASYYNWELIVKLYEDHFQDILKDDKPSSSKN